MSQFNYNRSTLVFPATRIKRIAWPVLPLNVCPCVCRCVMQAIEVSQCLSTISIDRLVTIIGSGLMNRVSTLCRRPIGDYYVNLKTFTTYDFIRLLERDFGYAIMGLYFIAVMN